MSFIPISITLLCLKESLKYLNELSFIMGWGSWEKGLG